MNKSTPEEGVDLEAHLYKKYGSRAIQMLNDPNTYLRVSGRKVGIEFNNGRKVLPTARAHALMEHAKEAKGNDVANNIMEEIFHRYFEKAENINSEEVLCDIASKVGGIEEETAKEAMKDDKFLYAVEQKDSIHKERMRISGVPFFIIERAGGKRPIGFSGAQPVDVIAEQLEEAAEE